MGSNTQDQAALRGFVHSSVGSSMMLELWSENSELRLVGVEGEKEGKNSTV